MHFQFLLFLTFFSDDLFRCDKEKIPTEEDNPLFVYY